MSDDEEFKKAWALVSQRMFSKSGPSSERMQPFEERLKRKSEVTPPTNMSDHQPDRHQSKGIASVGDFHAPTHGFATSSPSQTMKTEHAFQPLEQVYGYKPTPNNPIRQSLENIFQKKPETAGRPSSSSVECELKKTMAPYQVQRKQFGNFFFLNFVYSNSKIGFLKFKNGFVLHRIKKAEITYC